MIAHVNDRLLTASITTKNETYIVEPMWRHGPTSLASRSNLNARDMIVYRESDVNASRLEFPHAKQGFCDTKNLMNQFRKQKQVLANFFIFLPNSTTVCFVIFINCQPH